MTPSEVLAECARRGITLRAEGGAIHYSCPKGALTDDLRAAIREHKAELLRLLSAPPPTVPAERVLPVTAPPLGRGSGPSLTQAGGITLALSLLPDGTCYCCKGSRWWLSRYGVLVCATCHPPADPGLVARYLDGEEAMGLDRPGADARHP